MSDDPQRLCRLLFVPEGSISNPKANSYSRQIARACEAAGLHVVSARLKSPADLLQALRQRRRTVAMVNWLENHIVDDEGRFSVGGALKYFRRLLKLRLLAAVVLYVEHNHYPHNTREASRPIVTRTIRLGVRLCADRIITHDDDPTRQRSYLPHPIYPLHPSTRVRFERRIACFGIIAPRKGLEDLVDRWSGDYGLLLAGYARDAKYLQALQSRAAGKNIAFRTDEPSDEAAAELVSACAAVIVVNNSPSTIVSASLYFALSCGVPVVTVGLEHAKRLAEAGTPGVHYIASLDKLASVDWNLIVADDRRAIYAHAHRHFGVNAVASRLAAILEDVALRKSGRVSAPLQDRSR